MRGRSGASCLLVAVLVAATLLDGGGAAGTPRRWARSAGFSPNGETLQLRGGGGQGGCLPSAGGLLEALLRGLRGDPSPGGGRGKAGSGMPHHPHVGRGAPAPPPLEPRPSGHGAREAPHAEAADREMVELGGHADGPHPSGPGRPLLSPSPTPAEPPSLQGEGGGGVRKPNFSRKGSGMLVENNDLPAEVMHGYEKGYAALQWNADGTLAQGIVPLQYESSHSSSSPPTSSPPSSSPSPSCSEEGEDPAPAPMRRWVKKASRRGDRRAERVRERWEREGFTTYVPISPCDDAADDSPLPGSEGALGHVAQQWRASIARRHRLFNARVLGAAGVCASQGRREAMEDACSALPRDGLPHPSVLGGGWRLFGVYDGHGGSRASHYCRDHLLATVASFASGPGPAGGGAPDAEGVAEAMRAAFVKTDQHFVADAERHEWMDGTTALVAGVSEDHIVVANAGDSRAVMGVVRQGTVEGEEVVSAVPLSRDHRPRDPVELARIEAAGGIVVQRRGIARVMGVLAVARAIGDAQLKPYVPADPDVCVAARAEETWFVILATDGLWDVMSDKEAVELVLERLLDGSSQFRGARRLCHEAYTRGTTDNISVIVVDLRRRRFASCVASRDAETDWWDSEGELG